MSEFHSKQLDWVASRRGFLGGAGVLALGSLCGCEALRLPLEPEAPRSLGEADPALEAFLAQAMQAEHIPGLSLAIFDRQGTRWARALGLADIEAQRPMQIDTIMNIGSVSKTITASAIMQLVEDGAFGLDADVESLLPFRVRNPLHPGSSISIRQLLAHRSSIKDGSGYEQSYTRGDPTLSLGQWLRDYLTPGGAYYDARRNFHLWAPGEQRPPRQPRPYTNVGYGLLGFVVECVSGVPFSDYCRANIFEPLGMQDTGWFLREIDASRHAVPYSYYAEGLELAADESLAAYLPRVDDGRRSYPPGTQFAHCLYSFPNYPDGALRSTVLDLARFGRAYALGGDPGAQHGKPILEQESVLKMLSKEHYGRGLCFSDAAALGITGGPELWGHSGGDPGISTQLVFAPEQAAGAVLFFNGAASRKIIEAVLAKALG